MLFLSRICRISYVVGLLSQQSVVLNIVEEEMKNSTCFAVACKGLNGAIHKNVYFHITKVFLIRIMPSL